MIKILGKKIADKIAAGEVIERPVSIVKELVENSVDAGAGSITVEIKNGGKSFIRVTDDGRGIPAEEAETAFLRHATSKIDSVSDLENITTLGFRGEALASIAAVTNTSLITKTSDKKAGCRISLRGGETIENVALGCPDGTTVITTDLFYNMPARREFLKSDGAESGLIISFVSEMALAYPDLKFRLVNNGKILFTTHGGGNLKNAIYEVYKKNEYRDLIEVSAKGENYRINACISKPSLSRSTGRDQVFFVNGRMVKSKVIERGLGCGYKERLFEGRYPVSFLFLHVDPKTIDVNIHPNKKEVRFHEEDFISGIIEKAVRESLSKDDAVIEVRDYFGESKDKKNEENSNSEQVDIKQILKHKREESPLYDSGNGHLNKFGDQRQVEEYHSLAAEDQGLYEDYGSETVGGSVCEIGEEPDIEYEEKHQDDETGLAKTKSRGINSRFKQGLNIAEPEFIPFDFNELEVTGCIFDTYITATDKESFYLIDQHAAQERIFYEKLVGEYLADNKPSQTILTPILIEASLSDKQEEYRWIYSLRDMGYNIEEFGPNSYIIKEIPYFMEISEAENFVKDYIEQTQSGIKLENTVVINKLITRSCKSAIKAHDKLSQKEMEALMNDLKRCRNPFSCPHGRPTFIRFSLYDVEKMFKRA